MMKIIKISPDSVILSEAKDLLRGVRSFVASLLRTTATQAFTLVELSIVLVVIGLLVGGVLVGRDLISAAEVRAQITQIEKYNSAVNTFRGKFNALPGDMNVATAQQFGFMVGSGCHGQQGGRDGNGLIDGYVFPYTLTQVQGETALFWQDLGSAIGGNLIEGQFPSNNAQAISCNGGSAPTLSGTLIGEYFPNAKIGHNNYIYVYEDGTYNWFGLSAITSTNAGANIYSSTTIPVSQAYNIDKKIDDGVPNTGNIEANYLNNNVSNPAPNQAPNTPTSGGTSSSCYDTTTGTYSVTINNGSGGNCALSFKMQ